MTATPPALSSAARLAAVLPSSYCRSWLLPLVCWPVVAGPLIRWHQSAGLLARRPYSPQANNAVTTGNARPASSQQPGECLPGCCWHAPPTTPAPALASDHMSEYSFSDDMSCYSLASDCCCLHLQPSPRLRSRVSDCSYSDYMSDYSVSLSGCWPPSPTTPA